MPSDTSFDNNTTEETKKINFNLAQYTSPLHAPGTRSTLNELFQRCDSISVNELDALLRKNLDLINSFDEEGNTLLMLACTYGNDKVANYLLGSYTNLNVRQQNIYNLTALTISQNFGHTQLENNIRIYEQANPYVRDGPIVLRQ